MPLREFRLIYVVWGDSFMVMALEVSNLAKSYSSSVQALKGISLKVESGDFFALLGPNGAGKSTTLGIVSSLVNKTSGHVSIFGHDLDSEREQAKLKLGVVPQEFNFNQFEKVFDILVTQAGYYGINKETAEKNAEKYLRKLGLWDKKDSAARMLSGGMKRRLMIARALIHEPQLLILDEPTAGVDIELRRSMWEFLTEINDNGTTIILTTHYLEEAESLCRNIAIIDKGEILVNTDKKSLLSKLQSHIYVLEINPEISINDELKGFQLVHSESGLVEVVIDSEHSLNQLFEMLNSHNIPVVSIRPKTNRLEELFVSLTEK